MAAHAFHDPRVPSERQAGRATAIDRTGSSPVSASSGRLLRLLRPGSPYLGDVPVEILRLKFSNQMSAVEILDAKSGPNLVGDLAQAELQRRDLSRQHMRGVDVFNVHEASQIQEDLLVIHALNDFYKKGFIDDERLLLNIVVEKLVELGFEDKPAYIKGPQTKGLLLTVKDLAARVDEFHANKHYTLAVLLKDK